MKMKRKIIEIDEDRCDGCGQCVVACEEGAIQIMNGKAKVINDRFCDGLGACIGECPQDALRIIEREAEVFDEAAVRHRLAGLSAVKERPSSRPLGGCPSAQLLQFTQNVPIRNTSRSAADETSALANWPIQIHLVPPTAPFLRQSDLLLAADCVPAAVPNFHRDFLCGKVLLLGCPKLDDVSAYIDKLAQVFRTADIQSLTVAVMEVPCCSGLPMLVKQALAKAAVTIPMKEIVFSIREGTVLEHP
jgi:NAD-dependent dihydropyrimidine dehydrogenase PreA subunit